MTVDELAATFKALSNPQRLRIFLKLAACCLPDCPATCPASMRRCVGELGVDLDLAPSTVSHHLRELRQAGLMHVERRGKRIECWLNAEALRGIAVLFGNTQACACEVLGISSERGEDRGKRNQ